MNKLTKVGLSALCGSLATISSAVAGSLDVTGGAQVTWTTKSDEVTGNPIGMDSGLTFTGNGELDGGQTFSVTLTDTDKSTWSSSNITLNTNSMGSFKLSSAEGGQGIGGYDDNMPRAFEEVWDAGISTNANLQKGVGSSTNLSWTSPKYGGTTVQLAWSPSNDGAQPTNKGVSGTAGSDKMGGFDAVVDIKPQWSGGGLNFFLAGSRTEVAAGDGILTKKLQHDHEEGTVGLSFNIGPFQAGAQAGIERIPTQTAGAAAYYGNSSWSTAFNVNDNLAVSYAQTRHVQVKQKKQSLFSTKHPTSGLDTKGHKQPLSGGVFNEYTPKSWMRGSSIQISYTLGGIALKYADTEYDNVAYGFDAKTPKEARLIALSMAF